MTALWRWAPRLLVALFVVSNLWWIQTDQLVRDGDEEGHVGAAELFLHDLNQGQATTALHRAFVADMGDYPSLYPASVGLWWWGTGGGQPDRLPVRGFNLVFLGLAAWAVYRLCGRIPRRHAQLGAATVLFLPLPVGLSRHFMPEIALTACVALALAAAHWQQKKPSPQRALLLGLSLAAGMLTKQTFPLYVLAPLVLLVRPHRSLIWLLPGLAIALPWSWTNLIEQQDYLAASAGYQGEAGWLSHALFYPRAIWNLGLGPLWTLLLLVAVGIAWSGRHRKETILALCWLIGGLIFLTLVPKKYTRLMAPLLPAVGILFAAAIAERPRFAAGVSLGIAWTCAASFLPGVTPSPSASIRNFDPGQVQIWFRAPEKRSLGFEAIADLAQQHPGLPVLIEGGPDLTEVQTTHPWSDHLGPWLRREGLDREVYRDREALEPGRFLHVNFNSATPNAAVPLLNVAYSVSLEHQ